MNEVATWFGRPISELSRDELVDCINHLANDVERIRTENSRLRGSVDWKKYLSQPARRPHNNGT